MAESSSSQAELNAFHLSLELLDEMAELLFNEEADDAPEMLAKIERDEATRALNLIGEAYLGSNNGRPAPVPGPRRRPRHPSRRTARRAAPRSGWSSRSSSCSRRRAACNGSWLR